MRKLKIRLAVFCAVLLSAVIFIYLYSKVPRLELLKDVNHASSIIVDWHVQQDGEMWAQAFELKADVRAEFERILSDDLDVDFFRVNSTAAPSLGLYLTKENGKFIAYYTIRCARGGGASQAMQKLRELAMTGQPLTDSQKSEIFRNDLKAKRPHFLRFDYTLPVTH